ncbi:MAG: hypothetical protein JO170_02100 [Verrucomicrobia bacterium]|nr:hypothetical protein [Verrucomicrobiota bacterium]
MTSESALSRICIPLGIIPGLALFVFGLTSAPLAASFGLIGGWVAGALLTYIVGLLVLNRLYPWKKLVITAEFNGVLPRKSRGKAHFARRYFDKLYLVVDQQHRWSSTILPDLRPDPLDPLLIAELVQESRRKFFLIDQFDLTAAEQYLADEFSTEKDDPLSWVP